MSEAIAEICRWARDLPPWEQETLRRILSAEPFDDSVYKSIAALLLAGSDAPPVDLSAFESIAGSAASNTVRLRRISEATNVNALSESQVIEFGSNVTVVFGANASGKSGYARLFGSACFTRGDREVLPNFLSPATVGQRQRAVISIERNGAPFEVQHEFGGPVPELAGFYVFDTTCVSAHLTRSNTLTFIPPGLESLKLLAYHTDAVRRVLLEAIAEARKPHLFANFFQGESDVASSLRTLDASTDLQRLESWAQLGPVEKERVRDLELQIAALKLLDVPKAVNRKRSQVAALGQLRDKLSRIDAAVGDTRMIELQDRLGLFLAQTKRADEFGTSQFAVIGLRTPGSAQWAEFIQLAKHLAHKESEADAPYPRDGSRCLLCQQPLSAEAAELLRRMWAFLEQEAKQDLLKSRQWLTARKTDLATLVCLVCEPNTALYQQLSEEALPLLTLVGGYLSAAEGRRLSFIQQIDRQAPAPSLPPLPRPPFVELDAVIAAAAEELRVLEKTNPAEKIVALERELLQLRHCALLSTHLPNITQYVNGLRDASDAEAKLNTSHHITAKHNEMFDARVTDRYRALFEQLLSDLGRSLRVRIVAKGQKGTAIKMLELDLPAAATDPRALPQHVFSEGEKRAVVLADFLTEVTLDPNSSGVILDDPVTSLDADWKEGIARVLTEQSKSRQVIIFTHDLHFLYLLDRCADSAGIELRTHWIRRSAGGIPGYVFLNNSPASEKQYRNTNRAKEHLARAISASDPNEEERCLQDGFAALRTTYEVFVLRDMFGDVVQRFDERISIERLKEAHFDRVTVDNVINKVAQLSRYIEGHSHSDAYAAVRPDISLLQKEIANFESLRADHKAAKKHAAEASR